MNRGVRVLATVLIVHLAMGLFACRTVARFSVDRFWRIASSSGRPYRDYQVEYPPGTVLAFKVVAAASSGPESFDRYLLAGNVIADAVIICALMWGWGIEAATYFAVAVLPILVILFFRIDLWSVALTTSAMAAWQRQRGGLAACALASGTALKLWPLPFAVLWLARGRLWPWPRSVWIFGMLLAAIGAYWWSLAGWSGFHQVLTFRDASGWQIESSVGSVWHLLDSSSMRLDEGAIRIGSINAATSIAMLVVGSGLSFFALRRGAQTGEIGTAWIAAVVVVLVLSPLLSPQFLAWVIPGAAIAWTQNRRRSAVLIAVAVLLTPLYLLRTWPIGIVARNAVLIVAGCSAALDLWLEGTPHKALRRPPEEVDNS